jgi:hypothetical protein
MEQSRARSLIKINETNGTVLLRGAGCLAASLRLKSLDPEELEA